MRFKNTSILKTDRPGCYRQSISCLPLSRLSDTFRESIAKRFSAMAHRVISRRCAILVATGGIADITGISARPAQSRLTHSGHRDAFAERAHSALMLRARMML